MAPLSGLTLEITGLKSSAHPEAQAVSVALARAGLISSQVCYEEMGTLLDPANVRQDFLTLKVAVDRLSD